MDREILLRLLDSAREIARAAGRAILEIAVDDAGTTTKEDGTPLTRADMASHTAIEAGLAPLEPKLPVLSEEGDLQAICTGDWGTYWCVDPLDGTKEFVKGLTDYTVNIALVLSGRPILGVIDIPAVGVTYWAARGMGAWKCRHDGEPERIAPSRCERPASAVVSRSHLDAETERFLEGLGITEVVRHGSSLKICAVADGAADIYPRFGPTCLWDTAAGAAIAIEAGCDVIDLTGKPLSYDPGGGIKHAGFVVKPAGLEVFLGPG